MRHWGPGPCPRCAFGAAGFCDARLRIASIADPRADRINVQPPTMMRHEEAISKWLKPVQAVFTFEVK